MIVRSAEDRKSTFLTFYLSDSPLGVCEEIKYLGHVISDDWTDDKDLRSPLDDGLQHSSCQMISLGKDSCWWFQIVVVKF